MSICTRLDSRSETNDRFWIKNENGDVLAEIVSRSIKTELEVTTVSGLYIEKVSGFTSKGGK